MQKPTTILLLFVFFIFPPLNAALAEEEAVLHAVNYPPYEFANPDLGELPGFDVEVAIEAFRRMGHKLRVEFLPWKRILEMTRLGRTVGALTCSRSRNRDAYAYYSAPISTGTRTLVAKADYRGPNIENIADTRRLNVVSVSGYKTSTELKNAGTRFFSAPSDESALLMLRKRNFDVFYTSREFVQYTASRQGFADELKYFDLNQVFFHICFSKKWPGSKLLRDQFNEVLVKMKRDGTYDAIHDKYR